jgi:NAD(P)H-dependent FMN reductase
MLNLQIVTVSTRPSRMGPLVSEWFLKQAKQHGKFELEPVDLAEVNLPVYNESKHPRLQQYEHEHTKAWSAIVQRADAYVFVTPEYNYGMPVPLLNALTYLLKEWAYKPVGFVSYGGVSGGTRSVQMTKQVVTTLKMMPLPDAVSIPFFNQYVDSGTHTFNPPEVQEEAAVLLLNELLKWAEALKPMRG